MGVNFGNILYTSESTTMDVTSISLEAMHYIGQQLQNIIPDCTIETTDTGFVLFRKGYKWKASCVFSSLSSSNAYFDITLELTASDSDEIIDTMKWSLEKQYKTYPYTLLAKYHLITNETTGEFIFWAINRGSVNREMSAPCFCKLLTKDDKELNGFGISSGILLLQNEDKTEEYSINYSSSSFNKVVGSLYVPNENLPENNIIFVPVILTNVSGSLTSCILKNMIYITSDKLSENSSYRLDNGIYHIIKKTTNQSSVLLSMLYE